MTFLHGTALAEAICHTVRTSPVDIAVAFWGSDACLRLGLPSDLSSYRIACDARSGFCSPVALGALLDRGALLVDVPGLHAKVYISASHLVAGSANVSANGLGAGIEGVGGLEAGIEMDDAHALAAARRWFERIFASGRPVRAPDLAEIARLWTRMRRARPLREPLANAILGNAPSLAERSLRVSVYSAASPGDHHLARFKDTPYYNEATWADLAYFPFFWGEFAGDVGVGDDLLCFEVDIDGAVVFDGVWTLVDKLGAGSEAVWPAVRIETPFGQKPGRMKAVADKVTEAVRVGRLVVDGPPISLPDFAAILSAGDDLDAPLARVRGEAARAAWRCLRSSEPALGMDPSLKTGRVPAIKWHDGHGRYLFSFIPAKNHLLFYLRDPALQAAPELAAEARIFAASVNPAGETTIRIETETEARALVDWLEDRLPLRFGD